MQISAQLLWKHSDDVRDTMAVRARSSDAVMTGPQNILVEYKSK